MKMANDAELKEAIKAIGDIAMLINDVGNGIISEAGDVFRIIKDLPAVIRDRDLMFPEIKALDEAARQDLDAYINQVIPNATLAMVLQALVSLSAIVAAVKNPVQVGV